MYSQNYAPRQYCAMRCEGRETYEDEERDDAVNFARETLDARAEVERCTGNDVVRLHATVSTARGAGAER